MRVTFAVDYLERKKLCICQEGAVYLQTAFAFKVNKSV